MPICPSCQTTTSTMLAPCPTGDGFFTIDDAEYASHSSDRLLGRQIAGRFIVTGIIGHGSMGYVYKGWQGQVERTVALKIFRPEFMQRAAAGAKPDDRARDAAQQRFVQEARVLGKLSHANCVTVYDFGVSDEGDFLYIAMEYVSGISLRKAVRRGLKMPAIVALSRQILHALREAHAMGIVHRDLKPENIILSQRSSSDEQVVKVLDFGIAKLLQQDSETPSSAVGQLFGTPAYMSPEQCRGEADAIGPPSDVYAFGCMLYEMVSGHLPFESNVPQEMVRLHLDAPVPALAARAGLDVPEALVQFIQTCLAKDPDARYPNAHAALRAFDMANAGMVSGLPARTSDGGADLLGKKVVVPRNSIVGADIDPLGRTEAGGAEATLALEAEMPAESADDDWNPALAASATPPITVVSAQAVVDTLVGEVSEPGEAGRRSKGEGRGGDDGTALRNAAVFAALMLVIGFCIALFYYFYAVIMSG